MSLPAEIPDEIANGGVAAVVNYMLKNGFSKEYYKEHHSKYSNIPLGPWREKEYREIDGQCFGVSNTTLRKILNNEKVKESSVRTVVDHLTKALPAGNPTKEKWIACAVGQLGERNVRSHVEVKDDKKTNDLMCMDGTWVYILRRHGGQKFERVDFSDYIVGVFQWQNHSIPTAYNYGYLLSPDRIVKHHDWTASDCGVGRDSVFIRYKSEYFNQVTKEADAMGIIYAKYNIMRSNEMRRMAIKGLYWDTNTGRVEDGGEFYAEQLSESVISSPKLTTELARSLSEAF